jgi:hypothetical protein
MKSVIPIRKRGHYAQKPAKAVNIHERVQEKDFINI